MLGMHDVFMVKDMNWLGKKNGELLKLAENNSFNLFISNDSNLRHHQINLKNYKINFIILKTKSNNFNSILPLIPQILEHIQNLTETKAVSEYREVES